MKSNVVRCGAALVLAVLLLSGVVVSGQSMYSSSPTSTLSFWQARQAIVSANKYLIVAHWGKMTAQFYSVTPDSIRITATGLEFDAVNKKATKHLQVEGEKVVAGCGPIQCAVSPVAGNTLVHDSEGVSYYLWFGWYPTSGVNVCQRAEKNAECMHAAEWFAAALNGVQAYTVAHPAGLGDFHPLATAWRGMATKPALAEGARILRLAAEDAVKRQQPYEALNDFELGVEADPTWAQGWFNAALLAGELGFYSDAIEHMQNYLELLPNAADAQGARDQIDLWNYKAGQQSPASSK